MLKIELTEQDARNCLALFTIAAKNPNSSMQDTAVAVQMFGLFARAIDESKAKSQQPEQMVFEPPGESQK